MNINKSVSHLPRLLRRPFLGVACLLLAATGLNAAASGENGLGMTRYPFYSRTINYGKAEAVAEPRLPQVAILTEKTLPQYPHEFADGPMVINDDHYLFWAAKFRGSLIVPEDGEYVFRVTADEYANLILGGRVLIEQYGKRAGLTNESEPIRLSAGNSLPILIEYWNVLGASFLHLEWKTPGSDEFVTIPPEAFRPETPVSPFMVTSVRFHPAPGEAAGMVGGTFSGSLTSPTNDFEPFATIEEAPEDGQWNQLEVAEPKAYRYVKYEAPAGSHGALAELEFYNGERKLEGEGFGTAGSRNDSGMTWENALDGDIGTYYEGVDADHQYVGIDLGSDSQVPQPEIRRLETDSEAQTFVEITVPEGSFVRYSISPDESWVRTMPPTILAGNLYSGPFSIAKDRTILAKAFDQWRAPSQQAGTEISVADIELHEGFTSLHTGNSLMGGLTDFIPMIAASAGIEHTMEDFGMAGAPTDLIWKNESRGTAAREWIAEKKPGIYVPQPFSRGPGTESYWETVWFTEVLKHNPDAKLMIYMQWPDDSKHEKDFANLIRLEVTPPETLDGEPWPVDLEDYVKPDETVSDDRALVRWRGKCIILPDPENWAESMLNYMRSYEILYQIMDQQFPEKHVSIVPAGVALLKVYDAVTAGEMPGVDPEVGHEFFFADGAHLNPTGQYISALTHFAAIYELDPAGRVSSAGAGLTPEQADKVQSLVWDAVQDYPYSSVNVQE